MENRGVRTGGEGGIRTLASDAESITYRKHEAATADIAAVAVGVCDTIATRRPS